MQEMLNTKKFGDIAFRDKEFKSAIDNYSKVCVFCPFTELSTLGGGFLKTIFVALPIVWISVLVHSWVIFVHLILSPLQFSITWAKAIVVSGY